MKRLTLTLSLSMLLAGMSLAQTAQPKPATPATTQPAAPASSAPAVAPVQSVPSQPVETPPTDPYAPKVLSVAELSRKAQVIVRATVGAPLTIKEGEQNWRVYPLDILETLAGDAQALPKIKYQDKGAVLEKPALWVYADPQEAPSPQGGEAVLFLYAGRLDSPLVGFSQGLFTVNNSRVQGLPAGTLGTEAKPAQAATPATPDKAPLTSQGNPVTTAATNSSAPPAAAPPAVTPATPPADSNQSSASLPPSAPPTSPAAAANVVNGDIKPPAVTAPPAAETAAPAVTAPLASGQLPLDDFRKLVLSARSAAPQQVNP